MIYSMDMNIKKTKQYYRRLTDEDICDCSYCQNYVREIRATYGDVAAYLDKMGIEIETPFEVIPIGPDNETMFYSGAQYVVIGAADDFMETSIGTVRIVETDSHPVTDIQEEHFVIELSPIYLRWNHEE